MTHRHIERHYAERIGWLRAAVMGANDEIVSTLGALAARAGGANVPVGSGRVTFWGALAMAATALVGRVFGAVV